MTISSTGRFCLLATTVLSIMPISDALAQEKGRLIRAAEEAAFNTDTYPHIGGEVVVELQNEGGVDSDNPENDRNKLFLRTEVAPVLAVTKNFYIDGVAVLEPVLDVSDPGDDVYFEDQGIFIEEIKLNYEYGQWTFFGGKFNPGFGIAWDFGRGIFGEDFAEDYEITEKIGGGLTYSYETENLGTHELTGSTFFADTTFLSNSVITKRGLTSESDGGASNTESFESFVVSLDGYEVGGYEDLYYKVGYRYLAEGDADRDVGGEDESGWNITVGHVFPISERVEADVLLEYADINNFEGGVDDNEYFTASVIGRLDEQWNVTVAYTERDIDVEDAGTVDDYLIQVTGGYDFQNGLTLEGGWKATEEGDVQDNVLGALARYSFEF